ncbi:MAG: DUF1573 domain-containing protein [Bacteroidia bacterium]|nr:DUF1573 domain-containing protein [Bacteroidia bacterium]MCC6768095.1 DUF1573 domain-containing protein [Bacteroidia bacterium]
MRTQNLLLTWSISMVLLFTACDEKKDTRVTADIVTNSQSADGVSNLPVSMIRFEEDTFRFGEVLEGEKVSHAYRFTNIGNNDLVIANASGSCGCTVPEWPKEPIKPGKSGVINVVFDSERRAGKAEKSITIYANTEPSRHVLFLKGTVKPKSN